MIDYLHYDGGIDLSGIQGSRGNVREILCGRGTVCEEECWKEENLGIPETGENWCLAMEEIFCARLSTDVPTFLPLTHFTHQSTECLCPDILPSQCFCSSQCETNNF